MNSPELVRYSVLQTYVLGAIMEAIDVDRAPLEETLRELDALTMRLAPMCRSAVGYHRTTRGLAALDDAARIAPELAHLEGMKDAPDSVRLERERWSQEQAGGPKYPGMQPEETVHEQFPINGLALLADHSPED